MITKKEQELIDKIHHEFDSAQERLLSQAKLFIGSNSNQEKEDIEITTAERLKKLGFTNTELVKSANIKIEELKRKKELLVENQDQAKLINYYMFNYPFLKFLTEDELDRICTKYNLIYAPVSNYIKNVPEKNIKEIENTQSLKECDIRHTEYKVILNKKTYTYQNDKNFLEELLKALGKKEPIFTKQESIDLMKKYKYPNDSNALIPDGWDISSNHSMFFFIMKEYGKLKNDYLKDYSLEIYNRDGLFIAAPQDHFNVDGLIKKNKFGFFNIKTIEVKDPIVFRYVKGGIQVLSKWGAEGEDPSLIVPKLN